MSALIPAKTALDIYVSRWFGNELKHKTEGVGKSLRKKKTLRDQAGGRETRSPQWLAPGVGAAARHE